MSYETILLERQNHVTTVTLNRPDKLNALNLLMAEELHDALAAEDRDDETRVIVITGAGRAFCSGADLTPDQPAKPRSSTAPGLADAMFVALDIEKPIIASINGVAAGGGCTMTLSCDIRMASDQARFLLPFTKLSISAELGSTNLLPRLIGMGKATELILTSRMIDAQEAGEIGLVNHVVPADELLAATTEMAASIAALPPMAVRMNKRGLRARPPTSPASDATRSSPQPPSARPRMRRKPAPRSRRSGTPSSPAASQVCVRRCRGGPDLWRVRRRAPSEPPMRDQGDWCERRVGLLPAQRARLRPERSPPPARTSPQDHRRAPCTEPWRACV